MLTFAAFTPHSPLLTESVGKKTIDKVKKTLESMEHLAEELYASLPDTIVIISSHSIHHQKCFSINLHDKYQANLYDFGDRGTNIEFKPNLKLIDGIQRSLRRQNIPFTLDSDVNLDHGASVPLILLTKNLPQIKIIPVSYSQGLDAKTHLEFGRALKEILSATNERVAVIASGDLSHCLTTDSPIGFRKEGAEFDETVQESIRQMAVSKLISMDNNFLEAAAECAYFPLIVMFGMVDKINIRPEILSYEAPFGVGYLVTEFHLK